MKFARMKDEDLKGKTVLIREDLNVPIHDGKITNDARLQSSLPSIQLALDKGAAVIVCSHLGRPTEGQYEEQYSLLPIAQYLSDKLGQQVELCTDYLNSPLDVSTGSVVLLENVRFNIGEKANSQELSQQYANLCDVFVMDAFGTAHRAQASTEGVICAAANQGKRVCAGPLLTNELEALEKGLNNPQRPLVAVVGGSKVSTKLDVLISLAKMCDQIIVGGGIANTFIAAKGHSVGASLYEADMIDTANDIMNETDILLPKNVLVANKKEIDLSDFIGSLSAATPRQKPISDVGQDDMILDIAPEGSEHIMAAINNASTILWNGPLGVFEVDGFSGGTRELAKAIDASNAFSIAGGGDTLSAIHKFNVENGVSYMSTGGGAFLEFVEGKTLPAVAALTNNC